MTVLFVTGAGTEIGKTYVTCALARQLRAAWPRRADVQQGSSTNKGFRNERTVSGRSQQDSRIL
jgi:dethiobiotin synthetase